MIKFSFWILLALFLSSGYIFAQNSDIKYDLDFKAGLTSTLAKSGDNSQNQYINVDFSRGLSKSLNLNLNARYVKYPNAILGVEAGLDEFTYGYLMSHKNRFLQRVV